MWRVTPGEITKKKKKKRWWFIVRSNKKNSVSIPQLFSLRTGHYILNKSGDQIKWMFISFSHFLWFLQKVSSTRCYQILYAFIMNVVMKIVGIFEVWRYLKTVRRNKDVDRIEISKICSEWDFLWISTNFLIILR